jgi:hypothetical protein
MTPVAMTPEEFASVRHAGQKPKGTTETSPSRVSRMR